MAPFWDPGVRPHVISPKNECVCLCFARVHMSYIQLRKKFVALPFLHNSVLTQATLDRFLVHTSIRAGVAVQGPLVLLYYSFN